jgi:subtilase family serine protease
LRVELLEDRRLLDAGLSFTHIIYEPSQDAASSGSMAPAASTPAGSSTPVGLTPTQIRTAYGVNLLKLGSITGDGTGQTIAIIDAYDDPNLVSSTNAGFSGSDLHKFDVQFGLADPPSFTKLDENGGTNYPAASGSTGWSVEESLDVEWAHALAPGASIVLIEASSTSVADLLGTAVNTARNLAGVSVVSMSFGSSEFAGETAYDANFTTPSGHQGVTFVAASGDNGVPGVYPADSPNVVAAGGTTPTLSGNNYVSETGWSDSGGGQSVYESKPAYQNSVQTFAYRQIPDVAFDADPNSGVAVYDSYDYGSSSPWVQVGGTSVSAPSWAGLLAISDQLRVSQALGTLEGASQTLPKLYALPAADFHDITSGSNGYWAGPGYDLVTGRGSPVADKLVPALASYPVSDLTG